VSSFGLNASILTFEDGLVGHYTFENQNGVDSSGNGNDATILNATPASGRFTNNISYLCTADTKINVNLINQNISTVSIWFKVGIVDHAYLLLYDTDARSSFTIQGNHPAYVSAGTVGYGYAGTVFMTTTSLADDRWHHLVSSYDIQNQKESIYLNGIFVGQGATTFPLVPCSLFMMGSQNGISDMGPAGFSGLIDDVRIYSRSLSSSEISTLYATESVPEPSALSLLAVGLGVVLCRRRITV